MKTNRKMQVSGCTIAIIMAFALAAAPISFAYAKVATRTKSDIGTSSNENSSTDFLQTGSYELGPIILDPVQEKNSVQGQGTGQAQNDGNSLAEDTEDASNSQAEQKTTKKTSEKPSSGKRTHVVVPDDDDDEAGGSEEEYQEKALI